MNPRAVVASDHGAVSLKARVVGHLASRGYTVTDLGVDSEEPADYPDIAAAACSEFKKGGYAFGIVMCGTGIGVSISANKIPGIRCALVHDLYTAEMAKAHNDANFLAFGGRVQYSVSVEEMLDRFIETRHAGERHARRVAKIMDLDSR